MLLFCYGHTIHSDTNKPVSRGMSLSPENQPDLHIDAFVYLPQI